MRSKRAEWRRDTAESSRVVRDCPRAAQRCHAPSPLAPCGCSASLGHITSSTSTTGTRTCPNSCPTSRREASPRTTSTGHYGVRPHSIRRREQERVRTRVLPVGARRPRALRVRDTMGSDPIVSHSILVRHRRTMLNQWRSKYKEILANPQGESFMI